MTTDTEPADSAAPFDPYFDTLFRPFTSGRPVDPAAEVERFWAVPERYRPPATDIHDDQVAGPHGRIPVRVHTPADGAPTGAAVMWVHGGRFVSGNLDVPEADAVARALCVTSGCVVVSATHHLAGPGTRFPVPHHDVLAAWRWARRHLEERGLDPQRTALGGASAGANLAAGVALHTRDAGEPQPAGLVLVYPTMHAHAQPPSAELARKTARLPPEFRCLPSAVDEMTRNYLGPETTEVPDHAMPGQADLHGLPPTLLITAEYDDLRSSAEAFATSLSEAAVPTHIRMEEGSPHGYLAHPLSPAFDRSVRAIAGFLRSVRGGRPALGHGSPADRETIMRPAPQMWHPAP
ncbi:alpha/beta hydrolase [Streptomyces sp. NPDC005731]|uniref:alpha/beta hydrolase n=1 Tax=Streptomyces sp. NPDC005731 TaxID=3157056 RepID=UPI0034036E44